MTEKNLNYECLVIGTGAAGYNAACRLKQFGKKVAIITEGVNMGTSRNTGSDKQTYYKLGLSGDSPDSVRKMAENFFAGGSVDGDNALCEAALSARCFLNLCELGVAFPVNRYGEYVGYKTDHDPFERATSAGPLTSKFMTEALEKNAERLGVEILDGYLAVEVLKKDGNVCGLLCIEKKTGKTVAFRCGDIVMCTGGPAGIYSDSVYPVCHTGTSGLALSSGARAQSLTEWQYGLASTNPRWNVSGTYMQVLPRFVSVDSEGKEYEFLGEYFEDKYEALSMVFLKGYQWPFDSAKVLEGSSVIDLLVYRECILRGRRVYLDYTKNPFGLEAIDFDRLSPEASDYLKKANATLPTPIDRLLKMNSPAVDLYFNKGVDIRREYLEIALCAQHNNGGIAVDKWWQTAVKGLFAAGECAGTHGITRPGGSALNAGQVGSLRAAMYISEHGNEPVCEDEFNAVAEEAAARINAESGKVLGNGYNNVEESTLAAQKRMSENAGAIRGRDRMASALEECERQLENLPGTVGVGGEDNLFAYYKLKDILITQEAVLTSLIDYADTVGDTRGSALYYDKNGSLREGLEEDFRFSRENGKTRSSVQETYLENGKFVSEWRDVRPLPTEANFFENIWASYRINKNID